MNEEQHISFIGRIKNWYSAHRNFFRILQCLLLALLFAATLAWFVYAGSYYGDKEERELDNIYITWDIPEGKIIAKSSRELLTVPVSLKVSARKKNILYKLDNKSFRIRKNIPDDKNRIDIPIMPEDVEITDPDCKPFVAVEKVSVKMNIRGVVSDKKNVIFPIILDKNDTRKLRVRVQHDNNVPEICWVDKDAITVNGSKMNVPQVDVTGPRELLDKYYKDGWIDTEMVYLDKAVQPFKTNIPLLRRKGLNYSKTCVDVWIPVREYWKREFYNLPVYARLPDLQNKKVEFQSDLTFQNDNATASLPDPQNKKLEIQSDLTIQNDNATASLPDPQNKKLEIQSDLTIQNNNATASLPDPQDKKLEQQNAPPKNIKVILRGRKEDWEKLGKDSKEIQKNIQKKVHLFINLEDNSIGLHEVPSPDLFCSVLAPGITVVRIFPEKLDGSVIKYTIDNPPLKLKVTTDNNPETERSENDSQNQSVHNSKSASETKITTDNNPETERSENDSQNQSVHNSKSASETKITTDNNPKMENSENDSQNQPVQSGNTQGNAWWKWNRPH